jgi:hypothetical protein
MPHCLRKEGAVARLLLLLLLVSCTTTITKVKQPVFRSPTDSLGGDLNKLVSCQHININGKDIVTNGVDSTVLEIDIINGQNIPEDNSMIPLADSIASTVKHALQNQSEYAHYAVLFVKLEESANMTKRSWRGRVFSAKELAQ